MSCVCEENIYRASFVRAFYTFTSTFFISFLLGRCFSSENMKLLHREMFNVHRVTHKIFNVSTRGFFLLLIETLINWNINQFRTSMFYDFLIASAIIKSFFLTGQVCCKNSRTGKTLEMLEIYKRVLIILVLYSI